MNEGMENPWPDIFFYMDRDNFRDFKSRIYGFGIKDNRIVINEELPGNQDFDFSENDVQAMFTIIKREPDRVRIYTDVSGFGCVYLYEKDGFWALSNSLHLLAEKIGLGYLSLDEEMAAHWLCLRGCTPFSAGGTVFREIRMVPAHYVLEITLENGELHETEEERLDEEDVMSAEGVARIDRWIHKWTGIIQGLAECGIFLMQDLTGGFDSRVPFALTIASNVDLNKIRVNLSDTGKEMEIVKKLGIYFGFKINMPNFIYNLVSFEDALHAFNYTRKFIHLSAHNHNYSNLHVRITGFGGEALRTSWQMDINSFVGQHTQLYGDTLYDKALGYIEKITTQVPSQAKLSPLYALYRLSRMRMHFGGNALYRFLKNTLVVSPLSDPLLLSLHQDSAIDYTFLYAFILTRIAPDLLKFPFFSAGKPAAFDPSVLELAEWLNAKYPFAPTDHYYKVTCAKDYIVEYETSPSPYSFNQLRLERLRELKPVLERHYPEIVITDTMEKLSQNSAYNSEFLIALGEYWQARENVGAHTGEASGIKNG